MANGTSFLDVRSPGVNFLRKVLKENINTLQQTSRHDIPSAVGVLRPGSLRKTSSPGWV